jgi:LL-diaminopimelate aminotransferase
LKINTNYSKLEQSYLFAHISQKVKEYKEQNPDKDIIRLGIGDVTRPLPPVVVDALGKAAAEMGVADTFHGYGEEQGTSFLRQAICAYYAKKGVTLKDDEVFVSDGAKSDVGNILDIFEVRYTTVFA